MIKRILFFLLLIVIVSCTKSYDVVVIGGGTSGTAAAIQASRLGAKTLLVAENEWLGGMLTSAGVSAVDGNYNLRSGIWGEFLDSLSARYGGLDALKTGWVSNVLFEPKVGNQIFQNIAANEDDLKIMFYSTLESLIKISSGWKIKVLRKSDCGMTKQTMRRSIKARVLIDATELGDVAKVCGVGYDVGMESRLETGEDFGPEEGNNIIQDLTYVAILKDYGRDVTIPEPEGYDKWEFAGCCDNPLCINPKEPDRIWSKEMMISYGRLPNGKYMINWPIEGNDFYLSLLDLSLSEREEALKEAKLHTLRFLYFIQHELGYNTLALADDEFPTEDKLPFIPYHRESRRIKGVVRFTVNDILRPYERELYRTGIAVGDYPVDQHHQRYKGEEDLPNLYFRPIPSFSVPIGTLIPQGVEDLLVAEKSISVSNIANGATRLQPVVLQIGQAAGALAAISVKNGCSVSKVAVRDVQDVILDGGGYLMPYLDVPKTDLRFKAYQRIGAAGILRGEGKTVGWSNQTWLRVDDQLWLSELSGMDQLYGGGFFSMDERYDYDERVNLGGLLERIANIEEINLSDLISALKNYGCDDLFAPDGTLNYDQPLTRGEAALIIDSTLDPFHKVKIDIYGKN